MSSEEPCLGYLECSIQDDPIRMAGGLLVVDLDGTPMEFRHTHRVQPTGIQRLMYGASLTRYVLLELIGRNLCAAVSVKPDVLLVRDRVLLALDDRSPAPTVRIRTGGGGGAGAPAGYDGPTVMTTMPGAPAPGLEAEFREEDRTRVDRARPWLERGARQIDLLEPFGRVAAALAEAERRLRP
jgi:hypothetical protein